MSKRKFQRRVLPENVFVDKGKYVVIRIRDKVDPYFEHVGRIDEPGIWALAEAKRNKVIEDRRTGALGLPREQVEIAFSEASEVYWKLHGSKLISARVVRDHLDVYKEIFGDKPLSSFTKECVMDSRDTLEKRGKGNCDSSVNRYQCTLTNLFNKFEEWKEDRPELKNVNLPRKNPSERCAKPNTDYRDRTRIITPEEYDQIMPKLPPKAQKCVMGLIYSVLRQCDLKRLKKSENIDIDRNCFKGFQKKSGRKKKPFEPPITPEMWEIIEASPTDLIFDFRHFGVLFRRAARACGFMDIQPRDIRRTSAREMLKNGEDIDVVRQYCGHSSIRTTQRYTRAKNEDLQKASKVLSSSFKLKVPILAPPTALCYNCSKQPIDVVANNGLCVWCFSATKRKWRPMQIIRPQVVAA